MASSRLTNREKYIASCANPSYSFSKKEIKEAYKKACGHYWDEKDWERSYE